MAFSPDTRTYPRASAATTAAVLDAGLRAYMLRVYNWMSSGLLLTGIIAYTNESIARVFFITAATFAATSIYGYTTKADLSRFGSFLMMGLFGIIIASLVNIFLVSSALQFAISIIG